MPPSVKVVNFENDHKLVLLIRVVKLIKVCPPEVIWTRILHVKPQEALGLGLSASQSLLGGSFGPFHPEQAFLSYSLLNPFSPLKLMPTVL